MIVMTLRPTMVAEVLEGNLVNMSIRRKTKHTITRHLFHYHSGIAKTHFKTCVGMLVAREMRNLARLCLHRENAFSVNIKHKLE